MTEPENQGQHQVSQVYLKQFGHKREDKWCISICQKFSNKVEVELVENFSKEINIFDLPYEDFERRRYFENNSNKLEREYPKIINSLKNQHKLIPRHKDILCHYVANLICRTTPNRKFFNLLLISNATRDKFLTEIMMFKEEGILELRQHLRIFTEPFQLNIVIGFLMNHLLLLFRKFNFVILKDFNARGWLTSDNPVILDKKGNYEWIITIESEIYLPLSKDYSLFMFHKNSSKQTNPFRKLTIDKITQCSEKGYKHICNLIMQNKYDYLIYPPGIESLDLIPTRLK